MRICAPDDALKAKIGVLRPGVVGAVFIPQDRASSNESGLDIELNFSMRAQPLAVANDSEPNVDFGSLSGRFTAGTL